MQYNSAIEAQYDYNALGLWTTMTSGAVANPAAVTTYTYNSQLWLSGMQHIIPATGAVISSYAYTYDYVGNRTGMIMSNNGVNPTQTITYTYDTIYQLTVVTTTGTSTTTNTNTYDGVGNKLSNNNNGSWTYYAVNDANQVISRTSGATTVTMDYDGNGNLITETAGASIWAYAYDYENRLTNHNVPGTSNDMALTYDALDRRIMKNVNSGTSIEKYLYDGNNVVADYNNSDVCQASYVTPFLDHNLIISRSNSTYYYLHDGLGSVRTIVDTSSTMQNSYDYAADGVVKSGAVENISNRYKFTGREHDTQGNMYNYRARMYKPGTGQQGGRFMQRDPIGYAGGLNIYGYCGNNPVNRIDPFGLCSWNEETGEWESCDPDNETEEDKNNREGASEKRRESESEDPTPEDPTPEDPTPEEPKPEEPRGILEWAWDFIWNFGEAAADDPFVISPSIPEVGMPLYPLLDAKIISDYHQKRDDGEEINQTLKEQHERLKTQGKCIRCLEYPEGDK